MLYALSIQPGYLAPSAAIVRGEVVSVDGWNTLEQALRRGGWGRLGLNLGQWQGRLRCPSRPPPHLYRFPPGRNPVTLSITGGAIMLEAKRVLLLKDGHPVGEGAGEAGGFLIAPLRDALHALPRSGGPVDVLRIGLLRGVTVDARLVAGIIYTASQVLSGAHARVICLHGGADAR